MKTKRKIIFFFTLIGLILVSFMIAAWVVFATEFGTSYVVKKLLLTSSSVEKVAWQESTGSFVGGMVYDDFVLEDLEFFPKPNKVKIQKLVVNIDSFSLDGISVTIENGKLSLPDADPILINGKYEQQLLDFNVYTMSFSDREIKALMTTDILKQITGNLSAVDIFVKGTIDEPILSGELMIEKIVKDDFSLEQAPCRFQLNIKKNADVLGLQGVITCKTGLIRGKKTALVQLQESKIFFNGDPTKPSLDIKATSVVENIKINIAVKGGVQNPDLQINSNPPMSKDRLLLALATNKTWKNTEQLFNKGSFSPDIAKDFLGYFMFGEEGNTFAEKFGLKSVSVQYDGKTKGVTVTKDISSKLEGRYKIEETTTNENQAEVSQKVSGEYQITDSLSVEAQKEVMPKDSVDQVDRKETADDQLLLKFKKSF